MSFAGVLDGHTHTTVAAMTQLVVEPTEPVPTIHQVYVEYCTCGEVRSRAVCYSQVSAGNVVTDLREFEQDWGDYYEWPD